MAEGFESGGENTEVSGLPEQSKAKGVADRAYKALEGRKRYVSSELEHFAREVEEVGHRLEESGRKGQAEFAGKAAKVIEQTSVKLRSQDSKEILGNLEQTMRSHPGVAAVAAVGAAFVIVRLLRA